MVELPPEVRDAIIGAFSPSGSGGSSGETFGPMQYEPAIGKYVQIGSRGTVRIVGDPVQTTSGRDPSGYDPSTGLPYGVTRVNTTVSPTGLVYQGIPVNADGSPYTGSTSQVANYTGIKEGPGGLWGLNTNTGKYELIPGSETLGKPASKGPATYSGGGGYTIPRDYIGEANAKAQGQIAVAQAEAQAQQQRDAAQAALQRETLAMQQGFTREQNALSRAFQAAQQAWQSSVTNRQLQQQEEAAKRAAANDFRSAVSDTDPIAFAALMKGWGNLENAIRGGGTAVTDRALAGAAGLLDLIRRPFTPIPGFTWNEPTGTFVPNGTGGATGTTGGGATVPGLTTGGNGDASPGAATPGAPQDIPMTPQQQIFDRLQTLHQVGYGRPPTPEELALFWNISQGRGQDPLVTGNYSGIWQSVDPFAPNWRPPYKGYEIPGFKYNWETNQNERIGTPATGAVIPGLASGEVTGAGTPAIGGYTPPSSPVARGAPAVYIPGLAGGGMAKGAFIVGEGSRSNPSEHSELVIAPQGAHVVPLNKPQAKRLLNGGLRSYAGGTSVWSNTITPEQQAAADARWLASQQAPVMPPSPQPTYTPPPPVYTYTPSPQPTYTPPPPVYTYTPPPQPTYTPPPPVYTPPVSTGGNGTTTVAAPPSPIPSSAASSPSSAPPTAAPPVVNTTNTAAVATAPSTTTTTNTAPPAAPAPVPTTVSGLVNYGGQQVTPDFQALLDEIRNFRTDPTQNVYDRTLNPYDVSFNNLDPISQEVFYRGRQAEFGIPVLAQQWEQNRFRLPGLSRASVGIGY